MFLFRRTLLLALFAGMLISCAVRYEPPFEMKFDSQTIRLGSGEKYSYQRGTLSVAVNRADPSSRELELEFHRLPYTGSADTSAAPPIFILKGGPGFEGLEPFMQRKGYYEYFLQRYTDLADVIVVGHRGFGASGDTPCPELEAAEITDVDTRRERIERLRKGMRVCRGEYEQAGVDLSGYNVLEMSRDVIDIADALGYEKIQLLGNSFGSHWGLALIRNHETRISRATFSAIEGPDHTFDSPTGVRSALLNLAAAAPTTSQLIERFEALITEADKQPKPVEIDQQLGSEIVLVDGDALRVLANGYSRGTRWRYLLPAWPNDIETMLNGDLAQATERLAGWWLDTDMDNAAYFSIECSSGISDRRAQMLRKDPARSLISLSTLFEGELCQEWPASIEADISAPFHSDVPVLLIHGDWDTSTPYSNVLEVQDMLPNSVVVTVIGGSHGAMREAEEADSEFREAVLNWVSSGDSSQLPDQVVLPEIEWQ